MRFITCITTGRVIILGKDLVSKVLTEGTIVSTKLGTSSIWLQNIIYKSQNHKISISLLNEYLENIIMIGQPVIIKHSSELSEILYEGQIVDIHPDFPSFVKIHLSSVREEKNERVFPRYDVHLASTMTVGNRIDESFAIIHNLSLAGMSFYCKDDFSPEEDVVKFTIYLTNNKSVCAVGKIKRKIQLPDFIEYGLSFTEMHEENNNILSSFFSLIEIDRASLHDEYINCIRKHI